MIASGRISNFHTQLPSHRAKIQLVFDIEKKYCMLVDAKSQLESLICLACLTIDSWCILL